MIRLFILFVIYLCLLSTGCVTYSGAEGRINRHPELVAKLSETQRGKVIAGEVTEGMSKDAVFLAWGRPDVVREGSKNGKKTETWAYLGSTPDHFQTVAYNTYAGYGRGYGGYGAGFYDRYGCHPRYGYHGSGLSYGTNIVYRPYVKKTVDFSRDRVVSWERRSR